MAKMTEEQAVALLATAAQAVAQLGVLIPQLVQNWQAAKAGLASDDADALNAQIVSAHADIQALDTQLQALRNA